MAPTQAQRFDESWVVLGQQDLGNGFSAVLFQPVDTQGNASGEKVLAIRGTEASHWGIDYLVDLVDVAYFGTAAGMQQYVSLENFYQSLIAQGRLGATENFVTTGHSLGGFLAQAFAAKHIVVSAAYTYNAPGFSAASGAITNFGTELLKLFGLTGTVPNDKIFNVRAIDGISATAGLGQMIGSVQGVNIESGGPIHNHSIVTLTDSLAVLALYAEISPGLSVGQANWLLSAASSENKPTLESALDALRGTLLGAWAMKESPTPVEDREALHWNIDFLRMSDVFQSLLGSGNLRVLQGANPAELSSGAGDDFGLLVALQYLLPVAIEGAGDLLRTAHADLYAEWLADQAVEPEDRTFTENWLTDRARMLEARIAVNTTDNNGASPAYFRDIATNTVLGANLFGAARRTVFGGEGADTFDGGANEDRLYGGAGNDTIEGGRSADYIEGGAGADRLSGDAGNDELRGGAGEDTLIGGADNDKLKGGADDDTLYGDAESEDDTGGFFGGGGNDTLEGGAGADRLYGGAGKDVLLGGEGADTLRGGRGAADYLVGGNGADTYIYKSEDQSDLIYDEDGEGHIEYDGATLSGGKGKGKDSRVFFDNPDAPDYTYSVSGDMRDGPVTLTITRKKGGGQLTVYDFYDGDLGIKLDDGEDQPPKAPRPPAPAQQPGNQNRGDPLVIDLAGTGIATYGLDRNLHFDHDGDGFAEATGWAGAGAGMLVLDADPSTGSGQAGVLDDGQELFGDFTRLPGGQLAANGFQALSQYDRNRDGVIDADDPIWSQLRVAVWETGPRGETVLGDPATAMSLKTLDELGIASIGLDSAIDTATDQNGNTRTRSGQITLNDGATRQIAEYRFARDNSETKFLDWRPLPEDIAVLPELTLGGVQMDLTQALVRDAEAGWLGQPPGALREKLDAFLNETDIAAAHARFEDLLFAWTGADAIPEGTLSNQLDARHARVLEQAYGRSFQNPNADQAAAWQLTYEQLTEGLYASLLAQTHLKPLYEAIVWTHREVTGHAFGNLAGAQALLDQALAADPVEGRTLINEFGRLLRGLNLTRDTGYFALREHFTNNGDPALAFAFDAAGKPVQAETEGLPLGITRQLSSFTQAVRAIGNTALYGHGGDDVLYGDTGSARMVGGPGDNVLFGDAGDESVWGHEGDDVLDGGAGNDQLKGGAGDDTYIFRRGSGVDTPVEGGGVDRVFFGGGLTRADLFARRNQAGGYEIGIAGTGDVLRLPAPGAPGGGVELFMFSDGTLLRYTDLFVPTEGDDYLFGAGGDDAIDALGGDDAVASGPGDDSLHGGQGNDLLEGEEGNDFLFGDAGDDILIGEAGDDILDGGAGDDLLVASEEDRNAALNAWRIKAGRGNGNDTYRFGFGDGHDTIVDSDQRSENMDAIALKEGVTPGDVQMAAEGEDMVLRLSSGETLRVKGHFREDGYNAIERILFADGTVWNGSLLYAPTVIGTAEDDRLHAVAHRSTHVMGLGGNDILYGGRKDDLLEGGDGDDELYGLDGDDVLRGGAGEDRLEGRLGSDVYDGGAGNDVLTEPDSTSNDSPGADVFLFGRGDGQDTLVSRRIYAYDWWMTPPSQQYGASVVVDDVVRFKEGVSPDDITVAGVITREGRNWSADARIGIAGDPDFSLRIEGFLNGYHNGTAFRSTVKRFEFADGTVWSFEDIANRLVWRGTPDDDTALWGSEFNDRIYGYAGNDIIAGLWGDDTVEAGDGDDSVYTDRGNDEVFGDAGNDRIDPGDGNDVVDGGAGDDTVSSRYAPWLLNWRSRNAVLREGDLTILFGHGDGHDVVEITNQRADSNDVIRLKADVTPGDVKLVRVDDDLELGLDSTGDTLRVRNWFASATDAEGRVSDPFRVEGILFEDGTRWGVDEIRAGVLIGTESDEQLFGYADSNDLIEGRAGNDILRGDTGNDTYVFRVGDGQDTIIDATGANRVEFADRLPGDVKVRRVGGDLVLAAGDDSITIRDWFAPAGAGVQTVYFSDGQEWDAAILRELVLTGTPGEDAITGYGSDDTLAGLAGADALAGGAGNDSYVYRLGDGRDAIREAGGHDALILADILPDDVTLRAEGMDLVVAVNTAPGEEETDAVRVAGWFASGNAMVERIVFADGSELDVDSIWDAVSLVTDTDDYLPGTPDDDLIEGLGGNDTILGLDGDDVIRGGTGNDFLQGGTGINEYRMGRGEGFDEIRTTPSRTNVFPGFLEQADLELDQLNSSGGTFQSNYWWIESQHGDFYRIPMDIREPLMNLAGGVSADVARDTLTAMRSWLAGGSDTVVLGEGITAADLSVQYGVEYVGGGYESEGFESPVLAVGFGGDEGFLMMSERVLDQGEGENEYLGALALKRIRFADGSELSLDDLIAMADDGRIGEQYGGWDDDFLRGSVARDHIYAGDGADRVDARDQDDFVDGESGDDVIFGGTGNDSLHGAMGYDILAGGQGADTLAGDEGNDVYAYNRGDGADRIDNWPGDRWGDRDALSFGGGILADDVTAYVNAQGQLILQTGAEGDTLTLNWFNPAADFAELPGAAVAFAQFISAEGDVRLYDLSRLVRDWQTELLAADENNPLVLFAEAADYDITADWIGGGESLGGNPALAYALTGDLFAEPQVFNADTGDDAITGSVLGDYIDAGDGDNVIDAGAGADVVIAGSGNDTIAGGTGNDTIDAGPGIDQAAGGEGDDNYYFLRGYGTLTIDDLATPSEGNILYLDDISPDDIMLGAGNGELVLSVSDGGGEVRLTNFVPADPYAAHAVEYYQFSTGELLSYDQLIERGLNLTGTESSEILAGADGGDVISGNGGDDLIAGGQGSDMLEGGQGSDTYVFNLGDGGDTLIDLESPFEHNALQFGPGIDASQVRARVEAGDLILEYGDQGDSIRMPGVHPGDPASSVPFNLMRFADGSTLNLSELVARGLTIQGTPGDDVLGGAIGDDFISGDAGSDYLAGGPGDDSYYLRPGSGMDVITDVSDAGQSNTLILDFPDLESLGDLTATYDRSAGTLMIRVSGTDDGAVLTGFDPADPPGSRVVENIVFAGTGRSFTFAQLLANGIEIVGSAGNDVLEGTAARDRIYGLDGDDLIVGGAGSDVVSGGAGDDVYVFERGDGVLTIREEIDRSPGNMVIFGEGISVADIRNNLRFVAPDSATGAAGWLRIGIGSPGGTGDEVWIEGFDPEDAEVGEHGVESFLFDDGTLLSYRDLVLNTFIVQGDEADNALTGTNVQDRLYGYEGNDELYAGIGNDTLTGGAGDDLLEGGAGADMYVFNRGDGNDVIVDSASDYDASIVSFGSGIEAASIAVRRDGGDLLVEYGPGDSVRIRNWSANGAGLWELRFADGSSMTAAQMENAAPVAALPLAALTVHEDEAFSYAVPMEAFVDPEGGNLAYGAILANGNALPSWLAFDPMTRTFSGLAENIDVGSYEVVITATDSQGAMAQQQFYIAVANTNDAPVLADSLGDQVLIEDQPFALTIPADTFTDVDAGDTLTYGVRLSNGDRLPSWLTFDAATRTLSGTPANADVGSIAVRVTATDGAGAAATSDFNLNVANVNDAPSANPVADQTGMEDVTFSFTLPSDAFVDVDAGDALSHTATLPDGSALPAWLVFDAATRTFSGTPANADVGTLDIRVVVTDGSGATASDVFALTVANANDAPVIGQPLSDQSALEDVAFSYTLPMDAFSDVDAGDLLTLSATLANGDPLPSWLTFNAATRTFGGIPANGDVGTTGVRVTASDGAGASVSDDFELVVENVNDAPVLVDALSDQSAREGEAFSLAIPGATFADVDVGDMLSYQATLADGSPLPSWLTFNAATHNLTGTPASASVGAVDIRLTAMDTGGLTASDIFRLTVAPSQNQGQVIDGTSGNDVLTGTGGNDTIAGYGGRDLLSGAAGDDILRFWADSRWQYGSRAINVGSPGFAGTYQMALIGGLNRSRDVFDGGTGFDTLTGTSGGDVIALDEMFSLAQPGPRIVNVELIDAGDGNDVVDLTSQRYAYGDVKIVGGNGNDVLWSSAGNDVLDGGTGNDRLFGGAGNDLLSGGTGNDGLEGAFGNDVLQGNNGNDVLEDGNGNNLLDGGNGNDRLTDGNGSSFLLGGRGNDVVLAGNGRDVIAFNRGDGQDTVYAGGGSDNTLSLGGGIRYEDLRLRRSGSDLVLEAGDGERLTLKDWYSRASSHSVLRLQVIAEAMADFDAGGADPLRDNRVESFDFAGLADAFDAARAATPGLTRWALSNALLAFHLGGSDSAALGGDLAYQYGRNGTLAGIGLNAAQDVLGDAQFGAQAQTLRPLAGLQDGAVRLG